MPVRLKIIARHRHLQLERIVHIDDFLATVDMMREFLWSIKSVSLC